MPWARRKLNKVFNFLFFFLTDFRFGAVHCVLPPTVIQINPRKQKSEYKNKKERKKKLLQLIGRTSCFRSRASRPPAIEECLKVRAINLTTSPSSLLLDCVPSFINQNTTLWCLIKYFPQCPNVQIIIHKIDSFFFYIYKFVRFILRLFVCVDCVFNILLFAVCERNPPTSSTMALLLH